MKSKFALTTFAALAALGMGIGQADAATLLAEGFSYPDGQLTASTPASNSPVNVSGGLWVAHSGDTFTDNIDVLGGQAVLDNPGSEDANRSIGGVIGAADIVYYAAKFTVNSTGQNNDVNDDYFIHLKDSGNGFVARVSINDTATGDYQLGIQSGSSFALSGALSGIDLSFGTEYLVVVKWDNGTGTASAWLNPSAESDPSFGGVADASRIGSAMEAIALRQDFFTTAGVDSNTILVNGIGVATTFDEAVAGSMVPEPASLGLVALGGLAMLRRKA